MNCFGLKLRGYKNITSFKRQTEIILKTLDHICFITWSQCFCKNIFEHKIIKFDFLSAHATHFKNQFKIKRKHITKHTLAYPKWKHFGKNQAARDPQNNNMMSRPLREKEGELSLGLGQLWSEREFGEREREWGALLHLRSKWMYQGGGTVGLNPGTKSVVGLAAYERCHFSEGYTLFTERE